MAKKSRSWSRIQGGIGSTSGIGSKARICITDWTFSLVKSLHSAKWGEFSYLIYDFKKQYWYFTEYQGMFPGNIELEPAPAVEPIPVENEPEPESLWLVVLKEPKSDSKGDSKAGITPALKHRHLPELVSVFVSVYLLVELVEILACKTEHILVNTS